MRMGTISHTNESEAVQIEHPDDVCYHCGEVCIPGQYAEDDKHFCCAGCQTVYSILARHDMCRYYELEPHAGIRLQGRVKERYEYLDHPEVVEELVDFHEKERAVVRFHLPQIHCVSCIWLLENLHRFHEGINSGQVNFPKRELRLVYDPGVISLRQLVELLASIGYAPAISLDRSSGKNEPVDRSLIYRLGLAGFCFGNIMLLSFPSTWGWRRTPRRITAFSATST
jgi:P-type Cu+ transporter